MARERTDQRQNLVNFTQRNQTIPAVIGATNQQEIVDAVVAKRDKRGQLLDEDLKGTHVQALKTLSGSTLEGFIRVHLKSRPHLQSAAFWRWTPVQETVDEKRVIQRNVLGSYDALASLLSSILDTPGVAGVEFERTHDSQLIGSMVIHRDKEITEEDLEESLARVILTYKKV